jgi:hypothetical protein
LEGSFFFANVKAELTKEFGNLYKSSSKRISLKEQPATNSDLQRFQWLLMQIDLAKLGLFNLPNYTPLEGVLLADLWEVFTVLSALQARQDAEQKQQNDSNRTK